jgi:tetraacyldisaccharide 4'-kinase
MTRTERLERRWYSADAPPWLLRPLAQLYGRVADRRRARTVAETLPVPVVVVGNITVGGTGKTPVVGWLVERLREQGWTPGVISRGYGGAAARTPTLVRADSAATAVGDEPLLIHLASGAPVVVARDRVAAARHLLAQHPAVDVLISDDGLQHYRLPRVYEICVIDGVRGLGNGARLPAGPLREPPSRLREVDCVLINGGAYTTPADAAPGWRFALMPGSLYRLADGADAGALASWAGRRVQAMAGIGNPERFFDTLRAAGLQVQAQRFPDHHVYDAQSLPKADAACPLLMTEKDAVKCRPFAPPESYVLPVRVALDPAVITPLLNRLKRTP